MNVNYHNIHENFYKFSYVCVTEIVSEQIFANAVVVSISSM